MGVKKENKFFLDLFPFKMLRGKKDSQRALDSMENPSAILRLIKKCERLIAELKDSGNDDAVEEVLVNLAKLKLTLLGLFKKQQRKLLDLHYEKVRQENEEFLKRMNEQRAVFKRAREQ